MESGNFLPCSREHGDESCHLECRVTNGSRQGIGGELIELWVCKLSEGTIPALEEQRVVLFCADKGKEN
jgi:hypothetical protein